MFAGSGDRLISACHGISSLAELRKAKSVEFIGVRIDSFIRLNGICRDGNKRPCRNSHAIGKCERAHGKTTSRYLKNGACTSACRIWKAEEEIERTVGQTINSLGLPDEAVDLVHLVYPDFRPSFLFNHRVDLFTEGFDILRIRKKTVQYLRERLLTCND